MKHFSYTILLLICLSATSFVFGQEKTSKKTSGVNADTDTIFLIEGVGVNGIYVGKSFIDDVIRTYGKNYKVIKRNYSIREYYYKDLCLSFYFNPKHENKTIYNISAKMPCSRKVATSKGIYLGKSNLQKVINTYGETSEIWSTSAKETWGFEYPGIILHSKFNSWEEIENKETMYKKIVTEIDINTDGIQAEKN